MSDRRAAGSSQERQTVETDLATLITGGREDLDIDYKSWMDTSHNEARAKLARHLAALSNDGGEYLIFGISPGGRPPHAEYDRMILARIAPPKVYSRMLGTRRTRSR